MSDKAKWITLIIGTVLAVCGLSTLIYYQRTVLQKNRVEVERLRGEIEEGRKVVRATPDLEREVIVQRETDQVIKEILSDEEDITNFVRTINDFEQEAGITITSLKKQKGDQRKSKTKEDFDRVAYTIAFDGDAFQFLAFLDAIESYSRFISVTAFKLTGAKRAQIDRGGDPVHNISLNLETYVYRPKGGGTEVRIDNYERKRDMLLADIQKRSGELRVPVYDYRGPRGRRDPWVDPRIKVDDPNRPFLSIEQQAEIVEALEAQALLVKGFWEEVNSADNLIKEMKARAKLDEAMVKLEEELRRIESSQMISFSPSQRRLENNVVAVLEEVRGKLGDADNPGPTVRELEEVAAAVRRHLSFEEYDEAILAYETMEPRLADAERDPARRQLVEELHFLVGRARTVVAFEELPMEIGGVALMEGVRPVALINGETVVAGEYLDLSGELFVNDIRSHEIEFVYQGVTLIRRIEDRGQKESDPKDRGRKDRSQKDRSQKK